VRDFQTQLRLTSYATAWLLYHRINEALLVPLDKMSMVGGSSDHSVEVHLL
jgi:hypothetical protein